MLWTKKIFVDFWEPQDELKKMAAAKEPIKYASLLLFSAFSPTIFDNHFATLVKAGNSIINIFCGNLSNTSMGVSFAGQKYVIYT